MYKHTIIEYSSTFNTNFRPISNTQITTVEISPTGSGKNYFYKNSPNTIMLMPTNALVRERGGLITKDKALNGERTEWFQLDTSKCDYMTYDKFYGHLKNEDMSDLNIIIDEAQLLFSSDNERYIKLVDKLLNRSFVYKELKLISATLRTETLNHFFNKDSFDVHRYQQKNFTPHIYFTYQFPKINPKERTLIFINSVDKAYQIEEHCLTEYPSIKILTIKSGDPLPTDADILNHDLIISTSYLRQGYSIQTKIDKVIIHNVNNPEGAIGILQYMARPRNQTPEVFVVMASTYFKSSNIPDKNHIKLYKDTLTHINNNPSTSNLTTNEKELLSIQLKQFAIKAKQANYHEQPVLSSYLYEKVMKTIELYYDNGLAMKQAINEFVPNATIEIIDKLKDIENLKLNKLDADIYLSQLYTASNKKQLLRAIKSLENTISIDTTIKETFKKRVFNKLDKIKKVEPIEEFTDEYKQLRKFTDNIVVLQMLDENIYNRCKWHQFNLANKIYELRQNKIQSTRRLKLDDKQLISKISNKFDFLRSDLKISKKSEPLELLERIYTFDKYYYNEKSKLFQQVSFTKSKKLETKDAYIIIKSLYPVENHWYN